MDPDPQRSWFRIPESLRSLRNTNYRLFISGQIISLTGSWIQTTALSWLVYNVLTQSSFYLGLLNFASQIPVLLLGLFAGAVADTTNRHRLLLITQILFMFESTALAVLTLMTHDNGWPIITFWSALSLATFSGVLKAFDLPARQAFLLEMVPKEDLPNAVALNSLTFNCARIVGPSIAGIMIAQLAKIRPGQTAFGEGMCLLIDALSFLAVIYSLLRMKTVPQVLKAPDGSRLQYLTDGVRFVRRHSHVKGLMVHLMFMALFAIPYLMIMPVYAKEVLHGEAGEYGALMTAVGVGAVVGGVIMTRRKTVKGLGSHMSRSVFGFIAMLILLALNSQHVPALVLLALAGFFMVMAMIGSQTLVQTVLPEDIRGRVMSIYSMISVGFLPFGSLLSGAMAEQWGVRTALLINAAVCTVSTIYFTFKLPELRESAMGSPEYRAAIGLEE